LESKIRIQLTIVDLFNIKDWVHSETHKTKNVSFGDIFIFSSNWCSGITECQKPKISSKI